MAQVNGRFWGKTNDIAILLYSISLISLTWSIVKMIIRGSRNLTAVGVVEALDVIFL
jgi:hypothetical protein